MTKEPIRFLMTDDDQDDRELFAEALAEVNAPVQCDYASDGQEALRMLESNIDSKPDLIFLDVNMPVMSGWQCLTMLKKQEAYRSIPVVMYSTSSYQRDKDIAHDLGALCFITKPGEYRQLKKILETIIYYFGQGQVELIKDALKDHQPK